MLRWLTAGESHGPALVATIDGFGPANFVLIVTKSRQVRVVHSCFVVSPEAQNLIIVGVAGIRGTSPFRAMTANHLTRPMKCVGKTGVTPNPDAFRGVKTLEDFQDVKCGRENEGGLPASRFPSCTQQCPSTSPGVQWARRS